MPRFNPFLTFPAVTPQIGYSWYDRNSFIFQDCSSGVCKVKTTGGKLIGDNPGFKVLGNGNGAWAYVDPTNALHDPTQGVYHDSLDNTMLNTFPFAISPEGDICIKPFSNIGATVLAADGSPTQTLSTGDAQEIQLLSGKRWHWMIGRKSYANFPMIGQPVEDCYSVRCTESGVALYQRVSDGALIFNHKIVKPGGYYYNYDVTKIDNTYWITWATSTADTNAQFMDFTEEQLAGFPSIDAPSVIVYPKITRNDLYMGWFQFGNVRPSLPSNCELWTINGELWSNAEADLAQFANGTPESSLDALNAEMARRPKLPVPWIPYWTRSMHQGPLPTPPPGATMVVGVDGYKWADESLPGWEFRLRSAIAKCPNAAIIAQCYTSNTLLESDLLSLIPVYVKLCNELHNVKMLLIFSGSGRATGYQDHPEVHEAWQAAFSGITGVPALPQPHYPLDPPIPVPPIPTTPYPAAKAYRKAN